jgi:hypothetical protein
MRIEEPTRTFTRNDLRKAIGGDPGQGRHPGLLRVQKRTGAQVRLVSEEKSFAVDRGTARQA